MRSPKIVRLVAVGFCCALTFGVGRVRAADPQAIDTDRINDILVNAQQALRQPGFAVLVRRDGKTLFQHGYGVRDLHDLRPIDAQTNFRLASNSKQFTAMAIMLLVRDGKLRYDSTLRDVFAEFPAYGKNITMRQLLNHTSGLADYETLMDEIEKSSPTPRWSERKQITDAEVLALLERQTTTRFAPGTRWEYSNSGYVVLGLVVAKVSGESFGDFLHERIFVPLGMTHTLAYENGRNRIADRAFGHSLQQNVWTQTDQSSTSATLGDGGIYSNLQDLAKWDDALAQQRLLSAAEMKPALGAAVAGAAPLTLPDDAPPSLHKTSIAYGFGWFVDPYLDPAGRTHARKHSGGLINNKKE